MQFSQFRQRLQLSQQHKDLHYHHLSLNGFSIHESVEYRKANNVETPTASRELKQILLDPRKTISSLLSGALFLPSSCICRYVIHLFILIMSLEVIMSSNQRPIHWACYEITLWPATACLGSSGLWCCPPCRCVTWILWTRRISLERFRSVSDARWIFVEHSVRINLVWKGNE